MEDTGLGALRPSASPQARLRRLITHNGEDDAMGLMQWESTRTDDADEVSFEDSVKGELGQMFEQAKVDAPDAEPMVAILTFVLVSDYDKDKFDVQVACSTPLHALTHEEMNGEQAARLLQIALDGSRESVEQVQEWMRSRDKPQN